MAVTIKFNSRAILPDVVYSIADESCHTRLFPFLTGDNRATAAHLSLRGGEAEEEEISFLWIDTDTIELLPGSLTCNDHLYADTVVWYDGLAVKIETISAAHPECYCYDLQLQTKKRADNNFIDTYYGGTSPNERYVVFRDMYMAVRTVWDLKTSTQYHVEHSDRHDITVVGLSGRDLLVATFDWDYLAKQRPDCAKPGHKFRSVEEILKGRESRDNHVNRKCMFDRDWW